MGDGRKLGDGRSEKGNSAGERASQKQDELFRDVVVRISEGVGRLSGEGRGKEVKKEDRWVFTLSEEIRKRIISGVFLGALALFVVVSGGITFVVFVSAFCLLGAIEIYRLLEMKGEAPFKEIGVAITTVIPFVAYLAPPDALSALITFSIIVIFFIQVTSRGYKGAIEKVLMTYFGIMYVGWLGGAHAVMLRNLGKELDETHLVKIDPGIFAFIFVVASTVFADIGAYFFGKRFGRIKIAEKISPNKTLEGFLGGSALSIFVAVFLKLLFGAEGPLWLYAFFGFFAAFFGLIGDIAESSLKRDVHVKDSGFLIPGHGGVLDRVDSLLFTIPIFYYIFKYIDRFIKV